MGYLNSVHLLIKEKDGDLGAKPRSIEHHFLRNLKGCKIPKVTRINIIISKNKQINDIEQFGSIIDFHGVMDLAEFKNWKTRYEQKRYILDSIYQNLKCLFNIQNWDFSNIDTAYQKCLEQNLENEWYFKNKLFRSPDRSHYIGLLNRYDFEDYQIFEVLYDKNKEEIWRRIIFREEVKTFGIEWASWEGSNEKFYYKFDGPKKIFESDIDDLKKGIELKLPERTSDFFK